ncbi:MAG: transglycosylase SLT domain-containing protein [Candidatus Eremiobacteraeota bacterium]|nr:transglycosylase SLT domain-containing protein [Candidatus Eremiobacteraeota bacterium]
MNEISPIARQLSNEGVAFAPEIASAAGRHGVDPKLLAAVAAQETGGPGSNAGHNIVGDGGHGHGVFQIDDRYHDFARTAAVMDPAQNADYAAGMISGLLHSFGGDVHKALSAYNAGDPSATGTITEWMDGQRLGYADSVLRHCEQLGEPIPSGAAGAVNPSTPAADTSQTALDQIMQQMAQFSALQSFQAPSYAQLSGLDAFGHSRYDVSYAGLLTDDDSSQGDSNGI